MMTDEAQKPLKKENVGLILLSYLFVFGCIYFAGNYLVDKSSEATDKMKQNVGVADEQAITGTQKLLSDTKPSTLSPHH